MIIGLCGRAGSGKSSVARFLVEKYKAKRVAFADPLKKIAMDLWGFSPEQVYGEADVKETVDPRWGISPREAMQRLGQSARDHLSNDIWCKYALDNLSEGRYVVDDVRYLNEAYEIASRGFLLRLHCTDSISQDKGTHPSEAQVDLIPPGLVYAEIVGSREEGLEDLFSKVDEAVRGLFS